MIPLALEFFAREALVPRRLVREAHLVAAFFALDLLVAGWAAVELPVGAGGTEAPAKIGLLGEGVLEEEALVSGWWVGGVSWYVSAEA
jgi:hypothetical protein